MEMRVKDHVRRRDSLSFVIFLRCSAIVFRLLDVCQTIYWIDIGDIEMSWQRTGDRDRA